MKESLDGHQPKFDVLAVLDIGTTMQHRLYGGEGVTQLGKKCLETDGCCGETRCECERRVKNLRYLYVLLTMESQYLGTPYPGRYLPYGVLRNVPCRN